MVIGYKEMRDARDHNDYEFDLNIIFYDADEEWVRQQLQPALEEQLPQFQRNVFGDQDLILGMHYLDAVDYVVSHSYKTLILLSRAAVHDRWFMLKLRTAMDHVSDTETGIRSRGLSRRLPWRGYTILGKVIFKWRQTLPTLDRGRGRTRFFLECPGKKSYH